MSASSAVIPVMWNQSGDILPEFHKKVKLERRAQLGQNLIRNAQPPLPNICMQIAHTIWAAQPENLPLERRRMSLFSVAVI